MPDVKDMLLPEFASDAEAYDWCGTDARRWAAYFLDCVKKNPGIATDFECMTTWFASPIMAEHDAAQSAPQPVYRQTPTYQPYCGNCTAPSRSYFEHAALAPAPSAQALREALASNTEHLEHILPKLLVIDQHPIISRITFNKALLSPSPSTQQQKEETVK